MEVLDDVFVDKNSDTDPNVADSLSYSSQQVCETGRQDSLEIPNCFPTPFDAEDAEDTAVYHLQYPFFVFHRLLKDSE